MEVNPEILLKLLTSSDIDQFKALLGIGNNIILLEKFESEYLVCIRATHTKNSIRQVVYSFRQLKKEFGNVELSKLNVRLLDAFISKIIIKSPSTAALIYRTLKAAFNKAVIWDYITTNPFTKFKLPKFQQNKPEYLTPDQLEQLCNKEPREYLRDIYYFFFYTGLRASEALQLTWDHVNLQQGYIQIGSSDFVTKGKKVRIVPLPTPAVNILSKRFPKVIKAKKAFVFSKANGFPYTVDFISKQFKKAVRAAGLPDGLHLHSLRHSAASYLVQKGVPLYTVKEILGHGSIEVTQVYSHLNIGTLHKAMECFNVIPSKTDNTNEICL